jgi:hypothetical protein
MSGYGLNRGGMRIIGCFWIYASILEYLQHFLLDRHPSASKASRIRGRNCSDVSFRRSGEWDAGYF